MDGRCPRKLETHPEAWCPLAVLRLKAIRNAGRELTEEEESKLPGCPWAINHQLANYCFFKFINEYAGDKPLSDMEIAALNNISVDSVKQTEKSGLAKIRLSEQFSEIKEIHDGGSIVGESALSDEDYKIYR
jgi:hypothetical protein